jgi:hypothetical protein
VSSLPFPTSSFDFLLSSFVQNGLNIRVLIDHNLLVVGTGELNFVTGHGIVRVGSTTLQFGM